MTFNSDPTRVSFALLAVSQVGSTALRVTVPATTSWGSITPRWTLEEEREGERKEGKEKWKVGDVEWGNEKGGRKKRQQLEGSVRGTLCLPLLVF